MSTVHRDLSVTCSGCDETFANIETFKRHRRTGRCGGGFNMNRRLIGWALFVGPLVFWIGGMLVLAYADAGLKGLWMALILIVLMGSTMWAIYRIMSKGMSMLEDAREGERR